MLAYAANKPAIGRRQSSPNALLVVIMAHVAALALVMSARMDLPRHHREPPIVIRTIPPTTPPPPISHDPTTPHPQPGPQRPTTIDNPQRTDPIVLDNVPTGPTGPITGEVGPISDPMPLPQPLPFNPPVKSGPKLLTPASELKPPYPEAKVLTEEEAVLTLRLTVDDRGHVVAVDPVGRADRVFVDAARRYVIAHWRYQPASEDGHAITSSIVISLRFMLDR